jgi:hypothetical protein
MHRRVEILLVALTLAVPSIALAKHKKAAAAKAPESHKAAPNPKALAELQGKYKWGMSPEDVIKLISDQVHAKYQPLIQKESDVYTQDQLRKQAEDEIAKVKSSYIKFDGQKTGWDVSIVDREFAHRNGESMLVFWEKDQRRFLFFWNDRLYKQFIAFNSDNPLFQGKCFDDFAKLIEKRFGPADMKFANMRTKDEQTLDHLEWAPSGDDELWAIDQSEFYGNFCLVLKQRSVAAQLQKAHQEKMAQAKTSNALIDSVTTPDKIQGDPNSDIVDQITGTKPKSVK